MAAEDPASGGNRAPSGTPQETLQYFTPPRSHRPAWDPRDLLPAVLVLLVLGFDLLMVYFDQLSNDRGFYIVAILPPIVLLGIAAYAVRPKPVHSVTLVLGALFAAAVLVAHVIGAVFAISMLKAR